MMRFSIKIAFFTFAIIVLSLSVGGFIIIYSSFKSELNSSIKRVRENNVFLSNVYYSVSNYNDLLINKTSVQWLSNLQTISSDEFFYIGTKDKIRFAYVNSFLDSLGENEQGYQIITVDGVEYLQVITRLCSDGNDIYIENLADISKFFDIRNKNYDMYLIFLSFISTVSSIVVSIFSFRITRPLNHLEETSRRIANGNFGERISNDLKSMKSPEFVSLANAFNDMADKVEGKLDELQEYNRRQDDFISKFTHELKTPLTSIIGYSELLKTYDIDVKERHEYANYIYREGKRLENLSFTLLQLIILKKDSFAMKEVNVRCFFNGFRDCIKPLLVKYGIDMRLEFADCTVIIEPILIESLLNNLVDNSCKASNPNDEIVISGRVVNGRYEISVEDFGKGISEDSLDKVVLPFYMVDKARTRNGGGAGIGLSLCKEIVGIHNGSLRIDSVFGKGTKVTFDLEVKK